MYKQSKHAGIIVALISVLVLISGGVTKADSLVIPNQFSAGQPAFASEVNDNFTEVKRGVDDNDTRISALESSAAGPVAVDCTDPTALKNLILTPNTTYVLTGICDGQIIVGAGLGTINIEGDAIGIKDDGITLPPGETDADTVFAAIYGTDSVRLNLTNLTISVDSSYNTEIGSLYISGIGSYRGAHVVLEDVDVVNGDEGIGAYNTGTFSLNDNVSVTGFGSSGLLANGASVIRGFGSNLVVTGGSNQDWSDSEAVVAVNGAVIRLTNGGTITPASGPNLSVAQDTTAAVSAFRNGTIDVRNATLIGTVWSGESSAVNIQNVTHSDGNLDSYRNSVIRVRGGNVTGAGADIIFSGNFSTIRMDNTTVGNASGTGTVEIYRFGVIDLRGTTDMGGRDINCGDPREKNIELTVTTLGTVGC